VQPLEGAPPAAPGALLPQVSERVRIARLAHAAVTAAPGVARLDAGSNRTFVAADPAGPLEGVSAAARADGRYDVAIALVASYGTSLHGLADVLRDRVQGRAAEAGLGTLVGAIDVHVEDVEAPPGLAAGS
jgi:uncharacterized alkaline shock family protein YloU